MIRKLLMKANYIRPNGQPRWDEIGFDLALITVIAIGMYAYA